jgi:serine/threonine protein kinase
LQRTGTTLSSGYLVKILDFGLARLGDNAESLSTTIMTQSNVIMGTPDYLSPEQARNLHLVDIRSDLYSLGCTFYFLLTGQVLFPGGTPLEKLARHTKEEPTAVEKMRPDLPQEVANIVHCLLAKKPANRYQTPAELVMDLVAHAAPLPSAWAVARNTTAASAETLAAPLNTSGLGLDAEEKAAVHLSDRHSALAANLPQDLLPTAQSALDLHAWSVGQTGSGRMGLIVATSLAGGVLVGALGAVALMLFLR